MPNQNEGRKLIMRNAAILGYGAVPVGTYRRSKDGGDPPLEH